MGAATFPLSSMGADAAGVSHVTSMGLIGAVRAAGFTVAPVAAGAPAQVAGALAQVASDAVAYLAMVVLCIPPLALLLHSGLAVRTGATTQSDPSAAG